jgi:hypothetical protein
MIVVTLNEISRFWAEQTKVSILTAAHEIIDHIDETELGMYAALGVPTDLNTEIYLPLPLVEYKNSLPELLTRIQVWLTPLAALEEYPMIQKMISKHTHIHLLVYNRIEASMA